MYIHMYIYVHVLTTYPRFSGCTEDNASKFITPAQRSAIVWDALQRTAYDEGEGCYGG